MVTSVPFALIIFFYVVAVNSQDILFSQCFSFSPSPLCVTVTNNNCMTITAEVKSGNNYLVGPNTVPIVELLNNVQSQIDTTGTSLAVYCQEIPGCKICGNFNNISIQGTTLNACGNLSIKCSKIKEDEFQLGCFQVNNCSLLSCGGNGCSGGRGVCTNLGLCQCQDNNTGLDCGLVVEKNCINGQPLSGDICLENAKLKNCGNKNTVEVSLTINGKQNIHKMDIAPEMDDILEECQKSFQTPCELCPHAIFQILDSNNVQSCPYIELVCANVEQATYNFSCFSVPAVVEECTVEEDSNSINGISIFISCIVLITLFLGLFVVLYKGRKHIVEKLFGHKPPVFMSAFGDVSEDRNPNDLDDDIVDIDVDDSALGVVNDKKLEIHGEEGDSEIDKAKDE